MQYHQHLRGVVAMVTMRAVEMAGDRQGQGCTGEEMAAQVSQAST